jgi:hypothetical protein
MELVLWSVIGILTLVSGIGGLAALIALSTSKYRG